MENVLGYIIAYWFVAQAWLAGWAVVVWLAWGFVRLVRDRNKEKERERRWKPKKKKLN